MNKSPTRGHLAKKTRLGITSAGNSLIPLFGVMLISIIAILSGWATYKQFAVGITAVTLPALALLPLIALFLVSKRKFKQIAAADFWALTLYAIIVISFIWSKSRESWPQYAYWYSICIVTYIAIRTFAKSKESLKIILISAGIGSAISIMLASNQVNEWGNTSDRLSVEGSNSNYTSYVIAGTIYLISIGKRHNLIGQDKTGLIILAFMAVLFFGALGFDTRGAIVSIIAMAIWHLSFPFLNKKVILPLFISAFAMSILGSLGALDQFFVIVEGLTSRASSDLSGRLEIWPIARSTLNSFYLLSGIGAGAFPDTNPIGIGAHNIFLSILLDAGMLGLICFLLYIASIFRPSLSKHSTKDSRYTAGMFICFWIPIALTGMWETSPFLWLILGFTYNLLRLEIYALK